MSTANYNEDMRKAFPDKELKQPKKQEVVVENNNINNMEDDSMEQVNKLFESYKKESDAGHEGAANSIKEQIEKLGYCIEIDKETYEPSLVESKEENNDNEVKENNINKKENDNMLSLLIKCDNIENLYNELFTSEILRHITVLDIEEKAIYLDNAAQEEIMIQIKEKAEKEAKENKEEAGEKAVEELSNSLLATFDIIGYELDYRKEHMSESYPGIDIKFDFNRRKMQATALIAPAYYEEQIEMYDDIFEAYNSTKIEAYDIKTNMPCIHFVIYGLKIGEKEQLKKRTASQTKMAKGVNKAVDFTDNTLTTLSFGIKQSAKLAKPVSKVLGASIEAGAAIGTAVVSEVLTSGAKAANNIMTGKYVDKNTKKVFHKEAKELKTNFKNLKNLFIKEDKTYGDLF